MRWGFGVANSRSFNLYTRNSIEKSQYNPLNHAKRNGEINKNSGHIEYELIWRMYILMDCHRPVFLASIRNILVE